MIRQLRRLRWLRALYLRMRALAVRLVAPMDLQAARRQLQRERSGTEADLLSRVNLQVSPEDKMYSLGGGRHYLSVGLSAIQNIDSALRAAHTAVDVSSILDLPSGHGRVLRFLKVRFPEAKITACELEASAVRFCGPAFNVQSLASSSDLDSLPVGKFDLIFCGSLVTHLDAAGTVEFLRFFCSKLLPNGICVFTTHGAYSARRVEADPTTYGLGDCRAQVLADYHSTGYAYAEVGASRLGISLSSRERIEAMASECREWTQIYFGEQAWDGHQDVFAYQKHSD